jgi:undecaprenyl diphosphate synthase
MKMSEPSGINCLGIIMDGNRRWARAHDLPVFEGHTEGYKRLREVLGWSRSAGIAHVVVYALSTENWQRSEEEVGYLMRLFRSILDNEMQNMLEGRVRVRFVGDRSRFSEEVQKLMIDMEMKTAEAYEITLHLLMSYGGRTEIVTAANALLAEKATSATEAAFEEKLWAYPMPDPDLIIRTGGEKRLSGFLPWQSIYSELFFIDTFWPAFTKEEFDAVLTEFAAREGRRGK